MPLNPNAGFHHEYRADGSHRIYWEGKFSHTNTTQPKRWTGEWAPYQSLATLNLFDPPTTTYYCATAYYEGTFDVDHVFLTPYEDTLNHAEDGSTWTHLSPSTVPGQAPY